MSKVCEHSKLNKFGFHRNGKRRLRCTFCGRTFTEETGASREIEEILRVGGKWGLSGRRIAKELAIDKNTVSKYLRAAAKRFRVANPPSGRCSRRGCVFPARLLGLCAEHFSVCLDRGLEQYHSKKVAIFGVSPNTVSG